MFDPKLKPGDDLSNEQLRILFKCSTQGGMRRSTITNTLVIVSNHIKSIYDDRWIGDIFHYTGMGMIGDQSLEFLQNKTLADSDNNEVDVFLFEVFQEKKYTYMGPVKLFGSPFTEIQPDEKGNDRQVWMFPLKLINNEQTSIPESKLINLTQYKEKQAKKLSNEELRKRAQNSPSNAGTRKVHTTQHERSIYVSEYSKKRANGICDLCKNKAPFKNANGEPYLESHHIIWLSKGGADSINNTVALCPNCHRKMHVLGWEADKQSLFATIKNS